MTTQLFPQDLLPRFSNIDPARIEPELSNMLTDNLKKINALLAQPGPYTWDNLMQPMEDMADELNKYWSPIGHVHSVMETDALRKAYNDCLPHLTKYSTEISQNVTLIQCC